MTKAHNNLSAIFLGFLKTLASLFALCLAIVLLINSFVLLRYRKNIYESKDISQITTHDIGLILGASVYGSTPSPMLQRRLNSGLQLYQEGKVEKLLVSGDHDDEYYNEPKVMHDYLIANGVKDADILMDYQGFSTYESIARTKEVFQVDSLIIVSQRFHLTRALYLADCFGLDAIALETEEYGNNLYNHVREIPARVKDFFLGIIKPSSYGLDKGSKAN